MRRKVILTAALVALVAIAAGIGCNSTQVSSGILYQTQNNHHKAVYMFRQALDYNNTEGAAHYQLAWSLSTLAKDDAFAGAIDSCEIKLREAHEHYLQAVHHDPEEYGITPERDHSPGEDGIAANYTHYFNKAVQFNKAGQFDDAALYFRLANVADPRGERGFNARLSYIKLALNESMQAEDSAATQALIEEIDALEPPDVLAKADWTNTKATALNSLGRRAEAATLFEELLADDPDNIDLLEKVADARHAEGDSNGAGELLERIMNLVANDIEVDTTEKYLYGFKTIRVYYDAENYDKVLGLRGTVLGWAQSNEEKASIHRMLARAHYELEDWDSAIGACETLINTLDTPSLSVWQVYYLSLDKAGRRDEALKARERYLEIRDGGASGD